MSTRRHGGFSGQARQEGFWPLWPKYSFVLGYIEEGLNAGGGMSHSAAWILTANELWRRALGGGTVVGPGPLSGRLCQVQELFIWAN